MPRRGKLVDQLVMSCAVDGEPGLVLCFGILLLLFLFRRGVVFILIFGLGVLLRVSQIFGILLLLLLRFEIGSLKVPETSVHSISDCHRAVRYAVNGIFRHSQCRHNDLRGGERRTSLLRN